MTRVASTSMIEVVGSGLSCARIRVTVVPAISISADFVSIRTVVVTATGHIGSGIISLVGRRG